MPTSVRIDWNLPLIESISQSLLKDRLEGICDLSGTTIIVPTVQSGRRLRETLAVKLAENDSGLFPPDILTADQFLAKGLPKSGLAESEAIIAAWAHILERIDTDQFHAVFPVRPVRSTGWQLGMAQRLIQLRAELGEAGLDFASVAQSTAETPYEPLRWRQLAELEAQYLDLIESKQLQDPQKARRNAAQTFQLPTNCERILLIANPDPQPLPIQALELLESSVPIEVWIYGPSANDDLFDSWGRPKVAHWQERQLDFEDWGVQLHSTQDHKACANRVSNRVGQEKPEAVAIGIADPNLNTTIANALIERHIPFFDPSGQALIYTPLGQLTELLSDLSGSSDQASLRSLILHPDFWNWLTENIDFPLNQTQALRELDAIIEKHLAVDLESLTFFSQQSPAYASIDKTLKFILPLARELNGKDPFVQTLAEILKRIYATKTLGPEENQWKENATELRKLFDRSVSANPILDQLTPDFARQSFRSSLKSARTHPDRPRNAHDLLGWLELLWNDAPKLILSGFNEGVVPESTGADAFLPEPLRAHLGLRTNAQRFARDAYLLEALCKRRIHPQGSVDFFIPQMGNDGSPLKPSRLLFLCNSQQLLKRSRILFSNTDADRANFSHNPAWKLAPSHNIPLPTRLSVSALKSYLECPFRFFLKHILKMHAIDVSSRELTPANFGTVLHDSLKGLKGRYLDTSLKHDAFYKELETTLLHTIEKQFGRKLSFALRLQQEALSSRLKSYCEHQLIDITKYGSTRILDTEKSFSIAFKNCTIRGQIDRIDQREDGIELIDYKTANTAIPPSRAHLSVVAKKAPPEHLPKQAFFEHEGKTYRWTDLQLPLYMSAQTEVYSSRPRLAYFNLAKTSNHSGIERWSDFTDSHLESALDCAQAVIDQIHRGIFWPPNNTMREEYDEFAAYFPDGIEQSVDADEFRQYTFGPPVAETPTEAPKE